MNSKRATILIIDDNDSLRESVRIGLEGAYNILEASSASSAISKILKESIDLVLLDIKLPDADGIKLLDEIKKIDDTLNVIVITGDTTIKTAVLAMKQGAYDFITKPFDIDELATLVSKALEKTAIQKENIYLKESVSSSNGSIIGNSAKIKEVLGVIDDVAKSSSTILIQGETGVGKELVARAIHKKSSRLNKLFVALNCAAIPENLLESELFGHEKGSFTGALDRHIGKFEMADEGTLFLDEIGTLPPAMQAKLLRVLQDKTIERLGGEKPIPVDVRIISATNLDLKKAVREGKFREDLYYRLNVIPIFVPPLKEREGDIALLANHFIKKYSLAIGKKITGMTKEALKAFCRYDWPGNVRELENLIERIVVLTKDKQIDVNSLPYEILKKQGSLTNKDIELLSLKEATAKFEKEFISQALSKVGGSKSKAAKAMKIHRNTLLQLEKRFK